jgi:predicted dehydrogenase
MHSERRNFTTTAATGRRAYNVGMASTRRHFIQRTGLSGLALSRALAAQEGGSANSKVQFASIGIGGMGSGDLSSAVRTPGTALVGVCDIYQGRLTHAKEKNGGGLFATRDYREILNRKDVDAVIIATPDHWHARIAIDAMEAGKDVYVEKPMVQKWEDGRAVIDTARRTNRILQVGSQRVSSIVYQKAQELFRSGAIGELNMVEAWWDRNSAIGAWQFSIPPDATPENIDWDRFLGSAPKRPFEPIRLFRWRNYQDYGTGVAGDLFVHLFSGMHFVTGALGPERVFAAGGLRFWKDGRDVPDLLLGMYDYAKTDRHPAFNLALRVNFENGGQENSGFRFTGSEGVMTIGDGVALTKMPPEGEPGYTIGTFPKSLQEDFLKTYRAKYPAKKATVDAMTDTEDEHFLPPGAYDDHADHFANWFNAIRTRKPVVEDAVFGLRAAAPALLSNQSYFLGKTMAWDPANLAVLA